ncbi:MAG TPA: YaeQ family protein [Candidatus Deferrimicrobiaceae bacterium]|jgi:uncharacterized protein YaeQ
MALTATIFKADLNVADMDRHYYADHTLTIAQHPSETDERMMVRLLAFGLHADERLEFGRGLSATDEPDLWLHDLTGRVDLWIDAGQPDERRLRKACALAGRVVVYAYGGRSVDLWWGKAGPELARFDNLSVVAIDPATTDALAVIAARTMRLQLMVQDGEAWLSAGDTRIEIRRHWLKGPP